jgi:hypothetical protein
VPHRVERGLGGWSDRLRGRERGRQRRLLESLGKAVMFQPLS